MGGLSSVLCKLCKRRNVKILFLGLETTGKTTILYQMKNGEFVETCHTIGFNVESIERENVNFSAWDVGISNKIRPLLGHYYPSTEAVVFVIDSNDRERYNEAVGMLQETITHDELSDVPILILANKQDLSDAMTRDEIHNDLIPNKCFANRKWEVFSVSGVSGEGLNDGLDWITAVLTNTTPETEKDMRKRSATPKPV